MFWRLFFVAALLVPSVSNAEYNPRKLAQALGGYLLMTAQVEYLESSQCGYLLSTKSSVDQSLRDALLHFEKKHRKEIKSALNSSELLYRAKKDMDGALDAFKADGQDVNSSCGMLIGSISTAFSTITANYENAVSAYSK